MYPTTFCCIQFQILKSNNKQLLRFIRCLANYIFFYLKISLWGNRNDLSFFAGSPVEDTIKSTNGCLDNLEHLKSNIIVNHSEDVWNYIDQSPKNGENRILTIILDNGALELISDLCLATFCSTHNIFSHVRFYVKRIPWFVSDVTAKDFRWTLEHLNGSDSSPVLQQLSAKWLHFLDTRQWEVVEEEFWTLPLPYSAMKKEDKALYEKLSHSQLIIFKGDLNYRKLGADLHWPITTSFNEFLQGLYYHYYYCYLHVLNGLLIISYGTQRFFESF